jgi:hypothetical protein
MILLVSLLKFLNWETTLLKLSFIGIQLRQRVCQRARIFSYGTLGVVARWNAFDL